MAFSPLIHRRAQPPLPALLVVRQGSESPSESTLAARLTKRLKPGVVLRSQLISNPGPGPASPAGSPLAHPRPHGHTPDGSTPSGERSGCGKWISEQFLGTLTLGAQYPQKYTV